MPIWVIALCGAIALHVIAIGLIYSSHWFPAFTKQNTAKTPALEITLTPRKPEVSELEKNDQEQAVAKDAQTTGTLTPKEKETVTPSTSSAPKQAVTNNQTAPAEAIHSQAQANTPIKNAPDEETTAPTTSKQSEPLANNATQTKENKSLDDNNGDVSTKASLLDLSKISLSTNDDKAGTQSVFSAELRKKIELSIQAQKDYLKGVKKETNYPITEDADGTKYVNIKGVCWRMPNDPSKESWAIVFDGCGLKSKSFNFELNISPSMFTNELFGADSIFTLDQ